LPDAANRLLRTYAINKAYTELTYDDLKPFVSDI
jgi:hypothetical protein